MNKNFLELQLSNKFSVKMGKPFDDINSETIFEVKMPDFIIGEKDGYWNNLRLKIYNPIADSTSRKIIKVLDEWDNPSQHSFEVLVNFLDPTGMEVQKWIYRCKIVEIKFGEFRFSLLNEAQEISMVLKVLEAKVQ